MRFLKPLFYFRFLLDTKWFKQWKKYVGYESWDAFNVGQSEANPGPVDNSPLVEEGMKEGFIRFKLFPSFSLTVQMIN